MNEKESIYSLFNLMLFTESSQKAHGFMHVAFMGNWKEVLEDQIKTLESSGLYNKSSSISLCSVGPIQDLSFLPSGIKHVQHNEDILRAEKVTLRELHSFCLASEPCKVWYIHTKGVSHSPHAPLNLPSRGRFSVDPRCGWCWRKYMEYFVVERFEDCLKALEEHDVCGVNWNDTTLKMGINPPKCFSGNFWWANSLYVKTLTTDALEDSLTRFSAEYFIGSGQPKVKCFHFTHLDLYKQCYPRDKYASQTLRRNIQNTDSR